MIRDHRDKPNLDTRIINSKEEVFLRDMSKAATCTWMYL